MDFVSYSFVFLYLFALIARFSIGRLGGSDRRYLVCLLILSMVFYGWHIPSYLLLLFSIVLLHYTAARAIHRHRSEGFGKLILAVTIFSNIIALAVFKYADLFLDWLFRPLEIGVLGTNSLPDSFEIALPIAISFYTFQTISYSVDVYRTKITPEKDFLRFLTYVIFFPQLIAGPIVRASEFLYQFTRVRRPARKVFNWGGYLIIRGLFLKLVVADNLGIIIDQFWDKLGQPGVPTYVGLSIPLFFSVRLLCDFMAYTDIARGIAYQLGFRLPINFNSPYIATSFSDFWQRWHITLSRWFKDYLYIPLGGNRDGISRGIFNIILVFLLSGLWHGANPTFLAWGFILGIVLVAEVLAVRIWNLLNVDLPDGFSGKALTIGGALVWYFVVQLIWILSLIFFKSAEFEQAIQILENLFEFHPPTEPTGRERYHYVLIGWGLVVPVILMHLRTFIVERYASLTICSTERLIYAGIMLGLTSTLYASPRSFIYFQF
ncbi:MAG: alginate O-acetyltransferase complex protein AlgI [Parasphingorhabdus sp.]